MGNSHPVCEGKSVWVIGASSGLGAALSESFHKNGASVLLSARRKDQLEDLSKKLNAVRQGSADILQMDVADIELAAERVKCALDLLGGKIDMVVYAAGISNRGSVEETDISVEQRLFLVNFFSYVALTKALLPHFHKNGGGRFVVISSVQGFFGMPSRAPYSASKHALHGYFESLRAEESFRNIQVHIVCPGYVKTELSLKALTVDAGIENDKMDETTGGGYEPDYVAERAVSQVMKGKEIIVIAQFPAVLAIYLKRYMPSLLSWIMKSKGKKTASLSL